jgi:gluconolactonase
MSNRLITVMVLLSAGYCAAEAQEVQRDPGGIFATGGLQLLFDQGFFTEGPAMGPDGKLYFSDITFTARSGMQAGHVWRHDLASGHTDIYRSPSGMSNGLLFDLEDRLLAALGADFALRAVVRTELESGRTEIVGGLYEGRRLNSPNDLAIDERGRIYFTDPRYEGHEPLDQPVMGVYRIDPDGSMVQIINEAGRPNGILVSPDQSTLYVSSIEGPLWSGFNVLLVFDLATDGGVSNRRVLIDFRPDVGSDGMAIDIEGNLYLTRPASEPGVYVYSPTGEELAFVRTPELPTNAAFGRDGFLTTLFITAGKSVYSIQTNNEGYHPPRG